jgi:hypothetical protein
MLKTPAFRASSARAASLDGVLSGELPFDISRERFGEDSSPTKIPEAAADVRSGSTSAIYCVKSLPIPGRVGKQFGTRRWQCAAFSGAGEFARAVARGLPISGAVDL